MFDRALNTPLNVTLLQYCQGVAKVSKHFEVNTLVMDPFKVKLLVIREIYSLIKNIRLTKFNKDSCKFCNFSKLALT